MTSVFCLRNLPSHDCLAFPRSRALRHYNSAVLHDNPKLHRLVAITLKFCLHLAQMAVQSVLNLVQPRTDLMASFLFLGGFANILNDHLLLLPVKTSGKVKLILLIRLIRTYTDQMIRLLMGVEE